MSSYWVEKYRPTTIDSFVFSTEDERDLFNQMIKSGKLMNMTLSGKPGIGKTTIARILANAIITDSSDILTIDASDRNDVETMRDVIQPFATTFGFSGKKVVILEEADYLSQSSQGVLRKIIEDNIDNANFILTCNYDNKLMPALLSRCPTIKLGNPNFDMVVESIARMLIKEKVDFDPETISEQVMVDYPDLRKTINNLQSQVIDGKLVVSQSSDKVVALPLKSIVKLVTIGNWQDARTILCDTVDKSDYEAVYRYFYENIGNTKAFRDDQAKWEEAIVTIADHLYKHSFVADTEINLTAMMIKISHITS